MKALLAVLLALPLCSAAASAGTDAATEAAIREAEEKVRMLLAQLAALEPPPPPGAGASPAQMDAYFAALAAYRQAANALNAEIAAALGELAVLEAPPARGRVGSRSAGTAVASPKVAKKIVSVGGGSIGALR